MSPRKEEEMKDDRRILKLSGLKMDETISSSLDRLSRQSIDAPCGT